jgi:hypothetical protein
LLSVLPESRRLWFGSCKPEWKVEGNGWPAGVVVTPSRAGIYKNTR